MTSRNSIFRRQAIGDAELIQQILSGHTGAFAPLVLKYQKKVRGYCRSLLSEEAEAEDAAQEIFLKAYRSLPRFRGDSSFSTWLYHISSNHCLDVLRKRARRKTVSWDALLEREGDQIQRFLAPAAVLVPPLENRDLIEKILSGISSDYRALLTLRESEGLSYGEIAGILRCSVNAVKSRLARARKALRNRMQYFSAVPDVHISTERQTAP